MRILLINKFFYVKGGPERYLFSLSDILKANGHQVAYFSMQNEKNASTEWSRFFVDNVEYNKKLNPAEQIKIFFNTLYSFEAERKLSGLIDVFRPDIAHLQNYHHQLSPSILHALHKKKVPVVAKLPDYKMVCPSYEMLNHGKVCDICKSGRFYHCLTTKCFKNSFSQSLLATLESYLHHSILGSYRFVNTYICPSRFILGKIKEMGLGGRSVYLPNFIDTRKFQPYQTDSARFTIVYWGALSRVKGINTLVRAVQDLDVDVWLIGDGPIKGELEKKVKGNIRAKIRLPGHLNGEALFNLIKSASVAVLPSEWYENNPNSVLEAFAFGKPVIGARIGGIPELVKDSVTGLTFEPGNAEDLSSKILYLMNNREKVLEMGKNARVFVEDEFNAEKHYHSLMEIYESVI